VGTGALETWHRGVIL